MFGNSDALVQNMVVWVKAVLEEALFFGREVFT